MAPTVNWPTGEITVPKADTTLVSAGPPEIRSYNVQTLREAVLDARIAAGGPGLPWPKPFAHSGESILSGVTYIRRVEFLPPYFVTFEDGAYVVNLEGADHNVLDVATANQVSIRANLSAGKQVITTGSGLDTAQDTRLTELHRLQGLESGSPMTVTPTARSVAGITQTITGDGDTTTTVTRT